MIVVKCKKSNSGGCYGVEELKLLLEISSQLNKSRNLESSLSQILKHIAHYVNADRVMLTVLNRPMGKLIISVQSLFYLSYIVLFINFFSIGHQRGYFSRKVKD